MIEYLIALILGAVAGITIEKRKKSYETEKKAVSTGITASLFLLIFFLGFEIGRKLNVAELTQVGKLSVLFAVTTILFSYLFSRIILKAVGPR
jgi:uncharacterized membrane protein YbjE (DUF340 family)